MSWWLIVLISVLGYSLLITINNIVKDLGSGEDMNWGDFILGGIFTWLIWFINFIRRQIVRWIEHFKYRSLIQNDKGDIFWCYFEEIGEVLGREELSFKFADDEIFHNRIDLWDKTSFHLSKYIRVPNMRYAPRKVWKKYERFNFSKYKRSVKNG